MPALGPRAVPAMSRSIHRWVALLFAVGFVFACTLALLALAQYQQFRSDMQWTDHTYEVLARLDNVRVGLLGAESSQRNYLLTGNRDYTAPYQAGIAQSLHAIDDVARLTADNPQQQASIPELRTRVADKIAQMNRLVRVYDSEGPQAAQALVREGVGKRLMDDIQVTAEVMQQRERELLRERVQRREAASQKTGSLIASGLLAYLLLLLAAFILIRRTLAERRAAQEAAFRARELAEVTLHCIGDGVLITDAAGVVTDINAAAEVITGSTRAALRGMPVDQALRLVNRHTRATVPNPAHAALQTQQTVELEPDAVLIRQDGTEVGIEDSAAPIRNPQGEVMGAVLVFRDVTERRSLADKIANLALYDGLTGLANRSQLENRLQLAIAQAIRQDDKVGLVFMDLDDFKQVNDTQGHAAGDALLKEVAARLAGCLRAGDTACRVGGDEFIALLTGLPGREAAERVVEKFHAAAEPPARIEGHDVPIRFSAGIALYPDDADSDTELMRKADARMYEAKVRRRAGRR
ncbi:MAG: diguanylate cyclase [Nevskiaceae bacterium]|nr:MAG: diguanylate cyclase [Nevskiaceae bacterium]